MIKVCELVRRRADLSVDAFFEHWREQHGPIVAQLPGLRRYVHSYPLRSAYAKGVDLPFDGMAEVYLDDKDALRAVSATAEFAAAKADEPNFIDTDALIELVCDEVVIRDVPVPAGSIKNIEFLRFRDDLDPIEAHRYWREEHGPLAATIPTLSRYVQNHVRPGAYRDGRRPPFDGLAVTWFPSTDAMRAVVDYPELVATRADEANFLQPGTPERLLTVERLVVA